MLDLLLSQHPNAMVVAIDASGLFVPMPAEVPLTTHRRIHGIGPRSVLDMVVPAYRPAVIDAWLQAHASGAAQVHIHLSSDPAQPVRMHFLDVTESTGAFLGVFPGDAAEPGEARREVVGQGLTPRLATLRRDAQSVVVDVDQASSLLLGRPPAELRGERLYPIIHPDDQERAVRTWFEMLGTPGAVRRARLRIQHRDGTWLWFEATHHNRLDDASAPGVYTELLDITDEMTAHEALRAAERLLRRLTEALPLGVAQIDVQGRLIHRNDRLTEIVGGPSAETLAAQFAGLEQGDRAALLTAVATVLADGCDTDLEVALHRGGEPRYCGIGLRALTADSGAVTGAIVCVTDVTEMVRARHELEHRATHDPLTGCHNRASTIALLVQVLADCPPATGTAAIFLDLDGFKQINDEYGHAAGDTVLQYVVTCLTGAVRAGDVVGRLGGDEFLVTCPGIDSLADAEGIGDKLAAAIRTEVRVTGIPVVPRGSVGVAWAQGGTGSAQELIAAADRAMYRSKKSRRCGS
jgi:diguanylate cyclase (GGDEF)-like protein/PAS domain S-box-containing protein